MENLELKIYNSKKPWTRFKNQKSNRQNSPYIELDNLIFNIIKTFETTGLNEEIYPGIYILHTPKEIIEVMKLRSKVFTPMGYNNEFPETIKGLNFDEFDKNSLILGYKRKGYLTGSIRIILDSKRKLQTDSKFNLNQIRQNGKIAELSRLVVEPEFQKKGIEFKNLFAGAYLTGIGIEIKNYILGILESHKHLYERFGGVNEIYSGSYGGISNDCVILSWNLNNPSKLFQRGFLKNVR